MAPINTLHILNKAPEHPRSLACMSVLQSGDALLLTENAVLALAVNSIDPGVPVFALAPDLAARGLESGIQGASLVDYAGMVDLTTHAQKLINW
ncbi:hypothetical protein GCM10011533_26780 [Streptosporangium jomthongense]|uniref:Sulfurtransferase complex subunit TusB n=1 Tax=Marinobacter aromaticivorans TaxID=1494078 RepID=A0ABW2IWY0_9GAMM|nr:sulfurtransferase complex subunit TusB [Marinobacter aromaticivorans]GGE73031.1 hypothetical protein GCM10011533_26780 [Streptosporangium jomthongense]